MGFDKYVDKQGNNNLNQHPVLMVTDEMPVNRLLIIPDELFQQPTVMCAQTHAIMTY